jgi:hypothetical protein
MKKHFLALAILGLLTACSLPGSDLTSDDNKRELTESSNLRNVYSGISKEYPLMLLDSRDSSNNRCVLLEIDFETGTKGTNSKGQPIPSYDLVGRFTDVDGFLNEEKLEARYYEHNGEISFFLKPGNSKTLEITGFLHSGKLEANLRMKGYSSGDLRSYVVSKESCPNKARTKDQFSSKLEELFNGVWVSDQVTQSGKPFYGELSLTVVRIPSGSTFNLGIVGSYVMVTPSFKFQPVPLDVSILLNQKPISLIFEPKKDFGVTVAPKFYGSASDSETLQGPAIFAAFTAAKLTFKKIRGPGGSGQDQDQK